MTRKNKILSVVAILLMAPLAIQLMVTYWVAILVVVAIVAALLLIGFIESKIPGFALLLFMSLASNN